MVFQDPYSSLNPRHSVRRILKRVLRNHGLPHDREVLEALVEQVSALDVSVRVQVLDPLADLKERRGLGLLLVSHDLGVVRTIADRVVVMSPGHPESGPAAGTAAGDPPTHPLSPSPRAVPTLPPSCFRAAAVLSLRRAVLRRRAATRPPHRREAVVHEAPNAAGPTTGATATAAAVLEVPPLREQQRREHAPLTAPSRLVKFHAPEVVFGFGSLAEAGYAARRLGARRPLVVTDPGIIEAGWTDELLGHLRAAGLAPTVWSGVSPNPKDHEIAAGYLAYLEQGADVIIAVGGGSCIDAAKGIAILSSNGGNVLDYAGIDMVTRPIPPLLMIPSTSGTGADVSQFCIVTDTSRSVKVTIMGRALVPDLSIIDPRLLMTMPEWLTAATGLDALTHGIESFVSLAHNPLADIHALSAVGLVTRHLQTTIIRPADESAREGMAQASLNAGLAFTNAILGATHAMSHQVGGLLDAPHGVVNGILLPHVIRYNARATPERFIHLARAAGLQVDGMPGTEAAELLAEHVRELADDVGVPRGLRELGVDESCIARLAMTTLDDACLTTNPRTANSDELVALFRAAL